MTTGRLLRSLGGLLLLVAVVAGTFVLGPATDRSLPSSRAPVPTGPTVVVGVGSLTWDAVGPDTTPHLWSLLADGGSAALVVRSVHTTTCPVDGWLGLSAGVRASGSPGGGPSSAPAARCAPVPRPVPTDGGTAVRVPDWSRWRELADRRLMEARPGLLAETLQRHGRCVQAIGPGAAIAAADARGRVGHYAPFPSTSSLPLHTCPVTVVDVTAQHRVDGRGGLGAAEIDRRVGRVLAEAPPGAAVLVAALDAAGTTSRSDRHSRLRLLAVRPAPAHHEPRSAHRLLEHGGGLVWSTSTRQLGLVQTADVTATVLARAGVPLPDGLAGAPLRPSTNLGTFPPTSGVPASARAGKVPRLPGKSRGPHGSAGAPESLDPRAVGTRAAADAEERLHVLEGLGRAAEGVQPLVAPFFAGLVLLELAGLGLAGWRWLRAGHAASPAAPRAARRRVARAVGWAGTVAVGIPAATYLAQAVPWWWAPSPAAALVGAVAGYALVLAAVAHLGFGWHPVGPVAAVCVATAGVLAADAMTGSRLVLSSLLGVQPLVGGRYYGLGNVAFAVFATALLLALALAAGCLIARGRPRIAVGVVLVAGLGGVFVDGSPWWGSDLGGVAALLPAVLVLAAAGCGWRWSWPRMLGVAGATVAALVVLLVADWLRPPAARTHLGRFVEAVLDGTAPDVVLRKLEQNLTLLLTAPLAVFVPLGLAVAVWVLARPRGRAGRVLARVTDRVPLLRAGLCAVAVCLVVGLLVNDTGVAIPAVSALLLLPALAALAARTAELGERPAGDEGARSGGVRTGGPAVAGRRGRATRRGTARPGAPVPASPPR